MITLLWVMNLIMNVKITIIMINIDQRYDRGLRYDQVNPRVSG